MSTNPPVPAINPFIFKGQEIVAEFCQSYGDKLKALYKEREDEMQKLVAIRDIVRSTLLEIGWIRTAERGVEQSLYALDGAYALNHKDAFTELALVAMSGEQTQGLRGEADLLHLQHTSNVEMVAAAIMSLMEIQQTLWLGSYVKNLAPSSFVLMDGGRYSTWIHLKQLMSLVEDDPALHATLIKTSYWNTLGKESAVEYLTNNRIVGLQKLVSSQTLAKLVTKLIPDVQLDCYNDKVLVSVLMEPNEVMIIPMEPKSSDNTFISGLTHEAFKQCSVFSPSNAVLTSCYAKVGPNSTVLKLEVHKSLIDEGGLPDLLSTLEAQVTAGLQEPYINWVIDKLCKESVKIGKVTLQNTLHGNLNDSVIHEILNHGYRT